VIDELHPTVRVPTDLPDDEAEAIRRTLEGDDFTSQLRRAIRDVFRTFTELNRVTLTVTR
jgi:hypothetical protein